MFILKDIEIDPTDVRKNIPLGRLEQTPPRSPLHLCFYPFSAKTTNKNQGYVYYDKQDFTANKTLLVDSLPSESNIVISEECVRHHLKRSRPSLWMHITLFQLPTQQYSSDCNYTPAIRESSTVVPIPEITQPRQLSNFRLVALTPSIMKTSEKMVNNLVLSTVESDLDPLRFSYKAGGGLEDAKLFILSTLFKYLEKPQAHVFFLFCFFFNFWFFTSF